MKNQRLLVFFFSLLLAFCSLFYELVYAQILSVCLGGTKTQYLLIISLFTCALGLGSLLQPGIEAKYGLRRSFIAVEALLILLGSLGPFVIAKILQPGPEGLSTLAVGLAYLIIFVIGMLSGVEIPSLFAMAPDAEGKILAFDYAGMLLASLLFPFFFLPYLGVAASTLLVANLNMVALLWLSRGNLSFKLVGMGVNVSCFFAILSYVDELNILVGDIYLGVR